MEEMAGQGGEELCPKSQLDTASWRQGCVLDLKAPHITDTLSNSASLAWGRGKDTGA
jgi:hypothetical protein